MSRSLDRKSVYNYSGDGNVDTEPSNFSLNPRSSSRELSQARLSRGPAYRLPSIESIRVRHIYF
jgi:hypothetical protein